MRLRSLALALVIGFGLACTGTPDAETPAQDAPAKKKGKKARKGKKAKTPAGDAGPSGPFAGLEIGKTGVGAFAVGKAPPAEVDKLTLTEKKVVEEQEGTKVTTTHLIAAMEGRPLIDATLDDDGTIRELMVLRGGPRTGDGLGPNAIIGSIPAIYADASFHYSYVSERFWAESATVGSNVQFLIDPEAFTGDKDALGKTDRDDLEFEDFEREGKVTRVRIF